MARSSSTGAGRPIPCLSTYPGRPKRPSPRTADLAPLISSASQGDKENAGCRRAEDGEAAAEVAAAEASEASGHLDADDRVDTVDANW